jgi:hypothetical protein
MGAHPLIVVDLNDEKIKFAKHFGASIGVNASREKSVDCSIFGYSALTCSAAALLPCP